MDDTTSRDKIKATIILFCYNQEDTVRRAIDSLLRQKCDYPYEILVADDGSTDRTRSICEQYALRHPGLFRMLPKVANKGIVDNYFDAVEEARGEYVSDCAGDDEWLDENRLKSQIAALDADDTLSAVCCNTEAYDTSTGSLRLMPGSLFQGHRADEKIRVGGATVLKASLNYTNALPYVLSSALFRKAPIIDLQKRNREILRCYDGGTEDVPLIAALARSGDLLHLPISGYRYYIHGESASNNLTLQKEYEIVANTISMVRRLGLHYGLDPREQERFFAEKLSYLASRARHIGDKELSKDINRRLQEWQLRMPVRGRIHLTLLKLGISS